MKPSKRTRSLSRQRNAGGTLVPTLLITSTLGFTLASYMSLVQQGTTATGRSQAWNLTIPVLEGGIEEALTHLNSNTSMATDGWTSSGSVYTKQIQLGSSEAYCVTSITPGNPATIESQGFVRIPLSTSNYVSRRVRVTASREGLFVKGLVAKGQIDLKGNNIMVDSFDSASPSHSTGGVYDPAKKKQNGDVATNSQLINSLSVGNADIYGDVSTGPGGSVSIGAQGFVTGTVSDDMNVSFPDVSGPFASASAPSSGTVGGTSYTYVLSSGNWKINGNLGLSGNSQRILVTGDAVLHVTGTVSLSGNAYIQIDPSASLKLYVSGASTSLGGNGVMNSTQKAEDFQYFGLPTNTSVSFSGNAAFTGVIYAPSASLNLGGGGSTTYDFVGAAIANTITMNGHFNFHYDEDLANLDSSRGYSIVSWNEF
ncbi:MAG: hypothetical protein FJ405_12265 [Verrucomicrobia bacterium]|nr:hypothetical protein [Verrucomicrobiota bacterium]